MARSLSLPVDARIIIVGISVHAPPALAYHHSPAMPAEELLRQEIVHVALAPGGGVFVQGDALTDGLKQVTVYYGRDPALNPDVSVGVHPDIAFILEHGLEGVFVELRAAGGTIPFLIEDAANLPNRASLGVEVERLPDNFRSGLVYDELFSFYFISEGRSPAADVSLQGGFPHAPRHLLGELL